MIITITGKPCSGKGTAAKEFCKKYNFEYICTGDMFRNYAKQFGYDNILTFQEEDSRVKEIDKLVDDTIYNIGKTRLNENIVIDSRLAWNFIPNSFKVFIGIDDKTAGERLLDANRDTEQVNTLKDAIKNLQSRWQVENSRYQELYVVNNLDLNKYDFVINSANISPEAIADEIYNAYKNYINKQ